jgi:hypothetical protein
LAIANPNDQMQLFRSYFSDASGRSLGGGSITVTSNHQFTAFVNQNPFNLSSNIGAIFTLTSSVPIAVAATRSLSNERGDFLISNTPVTDLDLANAADPVTVPHFAAGSGWRSQIVLVNPTDLPISGEIQFFGQGRVETSASLSTVSVDGVLNATFRYGIPARSFRLMVMDNTTELQVGSIHINPAGTDLAPSAFATLSYRNSGMTVSEASISSQRPALTFRSYVQSSGTLDSSDR